VLIFYKHRIKPKILPFKDESLEAFGKIVFQLLQDVQERLVFRAHLYLQSDIQNYSPSSGDLAYPEKLEMMEVSINYN
jgi:conserved oligomeric Golgi complex subunit 3